MRETTRDGVGKALKVGGGLLPGRDGGDHNVNASGLVRIRQVLPTLSPAERRVGEAVLADPETVVTHTITDFAATAGASEASVVRFCRSAGFSGYPELRLEMAQAVSLEQAALARSGVEHGEIGDADSLEDTIAKIAHHEARAIEDTARLLDAAALERAARAIAAAERVELYGIGSSALTAADLQQKLVRIGLNATQQTDPHLALTSAALLHGGSVIVAVSHSGRTVETHQVVDLARSNGALAIGITNFPASPLGERCDIVLSTAARETEFRSAALSSRIAQLAVVDFLFVRVAQGQLPAAAESLRRTYEAVKPHRPLAERGR